ncbi:MAG TPA: tetratricopeptide repeat protein [Steroidobacteraceae bacterium]|nr:tetratricopeptide repeat protein [Steroidobacteraceae bacterium]
MRAARRGQFLSWAWLAGVGLGLAACTASGPLTQLPGAPGATVPPAAPAPGSAEQLPPVPPRSPRLDAVTAALVREAHGQASSGAYGAAGATLERALRIEPDDPLLWVELGRVRLADGSPEQAEGFGRKALTLAGSNPPVQSEAWRLIADSLKARGRNVEALEAERHALGLAPR